jgi:probable rRNA maturation factor
MITTIYNKQKDLSLSAANIKLMVPFLLRTLNINTDEVILHFVTKSAIGKIHDTFFSDPTPTDCISFPIDCPKTPESDEKHKILGEVFVCPKVALEYANEHELDPHEETKLYIIHGILHLLGYDDLDSASRRKMRQMEQKCLKICEPFPIFKKRLS